MKSVLGRMALSLVVACAILAVGALTAESGDKVVEEIKAAFTADVNKKREQIEQGFKDKEQQLMEKYKEETTEGFV